MCSHFRLLLFLVQVLINKLTTVWISLVRPIWLFTVSNYWYFSLKCFIRFYFSYFLVCVSFSGILLFTAVFIDHHWLSEVSLFQFTVSFHSISNKLLFFHIRSLACCSFLWVWWSFSVFSKTLIICSKSLPQTRFTCLKTLCPNLFFHQITHPHISDWFQRRL